MKFKDFPVVSSDELKMITVDVLAAPGHQYIAVFNFFTKIGKKKNQGFMWISHMAASTLDELHVKVNGLFELGLFDGTELSGSGTMYTPDGEKVIDIDWNMFTDMVDITDEIATTARTLH